MSAKIPIALLFTLAGALAACSDSPSGPEIPAVPHTEDGAVQAAASALVALENSIGSYILATGVFTDELTANGELTPVALDKRQLSGASDGDSTGTYASLQSARITADVAARTLAKYAASNTALRGRTYAVQGYAELLLADLFCSGVPLSTVNLDNANLIYSAGVSRDSLYRHALSLFDSVLALNPVTDSLSMLAQVGKGRALLALGQFSAAAQAVANVPEGTSYRIAAGFPISKSMGGVFGVDGIFMADRIADREGGIGLAYRSSRDPRTLPRKVFGEDTEDASGIPNKYAMPDSLVRKPGFIVYTHFVLADWVEAQLIRAEAALHADDPGTWLQILNHLRATAPSLAPGVQYLTTPITLTALTDPGTTSARVDTMFAERAAWLFLTGHRQGDLRRLIRQYGRTQAEVYPTGAYPGGGTYGTDVTAPIPLEEQKNPEFQGCVNRDA